MSSAPELTPNQASAGNLKPRLARTGSEASAEKPAGGFASLLNTLRREPAALAGGEAAATAAQEASFRQGRHAPELVALLSAAAAGETEPNGRSDVDAAAALQVPDSDGQEQLLGRQVAEQIAVALDRSSAEMRAAATAVLRNQSGAGTSEREDALSAKRGTAASMPGKVDMPGLAATGAPGKEAPIRVAVTHQETHFAPVLRDVAHRSAAGSSPSSAPASERGPSVSGSQLSSPTAGPEQARTPEFFADLQTRFAGGRAAEASTAQSTSATAGPASQAASGSGPVKVLHLQLQPAELGTLEVRMRLTDAGLEIHIEASRPETAALLKTDREALASVLRASGYAPETVTVSVAEKGGPPGESASRDDGQPPASGARPDAQSGSSREQGGRSEARFRPGLENEPRSEQVHHDQDEPAVAGRHIGDLYL